MDFSDDEEVLDPFEIRNQFTDMLSKLTSSQQSVTNAAMFAMRHKKSYELCYEILRNEMKKQPIPARLNIFHVLDCICRMCLKLIFKGYLELLENDLTSIILDIAPENNPKGDANVKYVRKAVRSWRDKHFFEDENLLMRVNEQLLKREQRYDEKHKAKQKVKNEVTKRIEEDRIKQKKRKENAWILTPEQDEFSYYWDNLSPYSKFDCDDIIIENKVFYHNNYPNITNEQILRVLDKNEIENKLWTKPIVYNKKDDEEETDLYHKSRYREKDTSYQQGKDYDSRSSPRKRMRIEKDRDSSNYNDDQYRNKNRDNDRDDKYDRNNKYNRDDHYDRERNRDRERDRDSKHDKNDKYNRDDQYNKNDKYDREEKYNDRNNRYDRDTKYDKYDNRDKYNRDNEDNKQTKYDKINSYNNSSPSMNISSKPKSKNRIFVWDLDETLILFKSLLDGNCLEVKPQDRKLGVEAGKKMMKWIISMSENYFYYNDIEEIEDPSNLSVYDNIQLDVDLRNYEFNNDNIKNVPKNSRLLSKLLSYRYKAIKRKYDSTVFRNDVKDIKVIDKIYDDIDNLSHHWLSFMLSLLDGVKLSGSYGKAADCVLVSAGHLIPTLAKCVLYKLNNVFTSDKVWSSSKNGKDWCFKQIKKKYGDNYEYIVVGNSNEEKIASEKNEWTFFKIIDRRSLIEFNKLYINS